jgi:arylsulfatase
MVGSTPSWPTPATPPEGAPNIVFVLVDDVGFSDIGCFGSEIATPNLDRLAADGVAFTNFHVNPMCSPTRASLLTGLNCHAAGMGHIAQDDPGFPGYRAEIAADVATAAEVLRASGYSTIMAGKWHLCRDTDMSAAGPQHSWPLQRGFDRYFGVLEAFTNLHQPHRLVEDNHVLDPDTYPDDFFLTDALTDWSIKVIRERQASRPGQPFFLYLAHPAAHAPLMAKPDDVERYRDAYHEGWDAIRARRHARQVELGVIAAGTELPPRNSEPNDDVTAWHDLSDDERTVYARYMAVYAAMVDEIDQSVGRLRAALEETGQWENTMVVFLSDNGASREGEATGTTDYFGHLRPMPGMSVGNVDADLIRLEDIGTPRSMAHYPRGWAMASNTPFRLYKRNTHAGGHQVPCLWHWPKGAASGAITTGYRPQYGHCIDVLPTVLRMAGIEPLADRREMHGADLAPVLADPGSGEVRTEQYYELEGNRGYYADGWEAVTLHRGPSGFTDDEWEVYDLRTDPTELRNLAAEEPDKVAELSARFHAAAIANQVYPMDEGSGWRWLVRPPHDDVFREPVTIYPGTPTLERIRSGMLVWQRAVTITVDVAIASEDRGVLVSHGDQGGGYSLEVDDGTVWVVHNNGIGTTTVASAGAIAAGHRSIALTLAAPGKGRWIASVAVDGAVTLDDLDLRMLWPIAPFTGIAIGADRGSPVHWERYERDAHFPFTGDLHHVRYEPGGWAPDAPANFLGFLEDIGARYE